MAIGSGKKEGCFTVVKTLKLAEWVDLIIARG